MKKILISYKVIMIAMLTGTTVYYQLAATRATHRAASQIGLLVAQRDALWDSADGKARREARRLQFDWYFAHDRDCVYDCPRPEVWISQTPAEDEAKNDLGPIDLVGSTQVAGPGNRSAEGAK